MTKAGRQPSLGRPTEQIERFSGNGGTVEHVTFKREHKTSQMEGMNLATWSEAGTPNLKIQPEMRALAQSAAEMEDRGTASSHEVLLRIVNRSGKPPELG